MPKSAIRQFPISAGIEEGADPKQLPPGRLLSLVNSVWKKDNRVEKRDGTAARTRSILGGGTLSAAARLFTRGDELCLIDGANLYTYHSTGWRNVDRVPDVGLTWETTLDATAGVSQTSADYASGLVVQTWVAGDPTDSATTGSLWVHVIEYETGNVRLPATRLSASGNEEPRVVIVGTTAIVVVKNSTNIVAYTVNLTTFAVSAGSNLRTDAAANSGLDAIALGSNFVIGYHLAASVKVYAYDTSFGEQANATVQATGGFSFITLSGSTGDNLWVGYATSAALLRVAAHNPTTLAQTTAPTTVVDVSATGARNYSVCRYDATTCIAAWTNNDAPGHAASVRVSTSGVDANSRRSTWGSYWVTKPFLFDSKCYAFAVDYPVAATTSRFVGANLVLLELEVSSTGGALGDYVPQRYVGKVDALVGGLTRAGSLSAPATISATSMLAVTPFLAAAPSKASVWRCGTRLVNITRGASVPRDLWRTVTYGQESYVTGAVLSAHDGRSVFDYGFARAPIWVSYNSASPSAAQEAGNYLYYAHLEYRSAVGVLHRGPPTSVNINVAATPTSLQLNFIGYNLTSKQDLATGFATTPAFRVQLVLHRSTSGGSVAYRWSFEPTYNVTDLDLVQKQTTVTDGKADADIGGSTALNTRPQHYTSGGVLEDHQPVACVSQWLHRNRLWLITGDERTLVFSKSFQDDIGVAPGFPPSFRFLFNERLVGMRTLDEVLAVFSERSIWLVRGEGPAPNGDGNDLQVVKMQSDVGCVNARSLVETPDGIMFESERGIFLLTRDLALVFVGKSVQDTLASYPDITSATLVAEKNQVRITCNNAAGSSGRTLVFDYSTKQWSTFTYYDTVTSTADTPIADACMHDGAWTFVTPTGTVFREDDTTCLDGGSRWATASGELAWISEGGPLGFQRIRRAFLLGDKLTDCDFTLKFAVNHKAGWQQTWTWTAAKLTEIGDGINVGMRVGSQDGMTPRCRAFRMAWEDAAPSSGTVGTGQGFNLSAIGLEFVPKPSMDRRAARART
jgi:hypothetical protein